MKQPTEQFHQQLQESEAFPAMEDYNKRQTRRAWQMWWRTLRSCWCGTLPLFLLVSSWIFLISFLLCRILINKQTNIIATLCTFVWTSSHLSTIIIVIGLRFWCIIISHGNLPFYRCANGKPYKKRNDRFFSTLSKIRLILLVNLLFCFVSDFLFFWIEFFL